MKPNLSKEVSPENTAVENIEAARQRFERERLTRRKALRKLGIASGVAVVGLLSIDDLARLSAAKLKDYEATAAIGDSLAKEFRGAGVAFATDIRPSSRTTPVTPCDSVCDSQYNACVDGVHADYDNNVGFWCGPNYEFCGSIWPKLDACANVKNDCTTFCVGTPTDPVDPNHDPTVCQDNVDKGVLDKLVGVLGSGDSDEIKDALEQGFIDCTDEVAGDPSGMGECMKGKVTEMLPNGGNPLVLAELKQYLECAYLACLAGIEPNADNNPCKWD